MGNVLSVGIDESNHGLFPEIFCAVRSKKKKDIIEGGKKEKIRANFESLLREVEERSYSFLVLASKEDYKRIGQKNIGGVVAASLLVGTPRNFETLKIFFDGDLKKPERNYMRDIISEYLAVSKDGISIYCGGNYDQRIPLVNLADGMARYLFRKHTIEDLANK